MNVKQFFGAFLGSCLGVFTAGFAALVVTVIIFSGTIMLLFGDDEVVDIKKSVLYINLKGEINEYDSAEDIFILLDDTDELELTANTVANIVTAIGYAKKSSAVQGVFIECDAAEIGLAASSEIRQALLDFKDSGKWVYAYGGGISQTDYYIASAADSIFVNPMGVVDIHGLASTSTYYKNLLDNLGIDIQVLKSGKYKSAVEPYTQNSMSAEDRAQRKEYVTSIWDSMVSEIAESRGIEEDKLRALAADMMITKDYAYLLRNKIVDATSYRDETISKIMDLVGVADSEDLNLVTPKNLCSYFDLQSANDRDEIAVLYAVGEISEYSDGEYINYKKIVKEINKLAKNDDVKALVLRVNSPGGSAYDAEQIWEALERFKLTGKPFVISMGDLAASGGYYIACGADYIMAEPTTLTGSIGVFGIIPSAKKLMNDKIGVRSDVVTTNLNADLFSLDKPMNNLQLAAMQSSVNDIYDTFINRVATGRDMSVAEVDAIAQGRVWSGSMAMGIGLVDGMGGVNSAVKVAAQMAQLSNYNTVSYPELDNDWQILIDILNSSSSLAELFSPNVKLMDYNKRINSLIEQNPIQMIYYQSEIK